jgi:hypothetical protein
MRFETCSPLCLLALVFSFASPLVSQDTAARPGLVGEYFLAAGIKEDQVPQSAKPFFARIDKTVDFESANGEFYKSKLSDNFFVRWSGSIRIDKSGSYTFATTSDDGSRLYIDGKRVVENWGLHGMVRKDGVAELTAGYHQIQITFSEGGGGAGCIASWIPPGGKEVVIPRTVLSHSAASAQAVMKSWDRQKWRKAKRQKKPKGANGVAFTSSMGPVIATAVSLGEDGHGNNTIYRGIVVRLDKTGDACVVFDADTMRLAGGWTDGSLVLAGLPFTGGHGAYPSVRGDKVFQVSARPGWAQAGKLADPRAGEYPPLGHLPKDWAHYKGLYMSGDRVVLKYTVGKSEVWETPSMATGAGQSIMRSLRIQQDGAAMTMVLADAAANSRIDSSSAAAGGDLLGNAVAVLGDAESLTMVGARSSSGGALKIRDGVLTLDLPAAKGVTHVQVMYSRQQSATTDQFLASFKAQPMKSDVMSLTKGGAARWPTVIKTVGAMAPAALAAKKAYVVDRITVPYKNEYEPRMRIGGMDFFSDGKSAAVSTWDGDVWVVKGIEGKLENLQWKRFATGLHEPLGLKIVNDVIYTVDDMQITRFHDLDKNGEADFYENFNNDWQLTSGFHAFCFDLHTDRAGNFYFAFGSPVRGGGRSFERMGDHHGSILRVSAGGSRLDQYASGLRAPNGIGVSPTGQVTSGDNEGTFVPRCPINWISEGQSYGVMDSASLEIRKKMVTTATRKDRVTDGRGKELESAEMPKPLAWLPRSVDNSGGGQAWVTSDKWGPVSGSMLHLSYGQSALFLVLKEQKGAQMQGGVVKIPLKLTSSAMRARFNERDGQLYIAGLRGWQTNAVKEGGFDRIRFTGRPLRMPTGLRAKKNGVEITFSEKLDPELANDAESFGVRAADILWTHDYGSKEYKIGQRDVGRAAKPGWSDMKVTSAKLQADGRTVVLEIEGMQPVHEMEISIDVETADGDEVRTKIWNTVHILD